MFKGSIVALITPFKNNKLDEANYSEILHHHLKNGTNGVVPAGTTGESPTLSHIEHKKVINIYKKTYDKKIKERRSKKIKQSQTTCILVPVFGLLALLFSNN